MDKEQVIALAGQAGFGGNQRNTLLVKLMALSRLVEQAEREACAKICDERKWRGEPLNFAEYCAEEIRMRSNDLGNRRDAGPIGGASGSPTS